VLVYGLHLGLNGSAIANVAAQAIGGALFLRALRRAAPSLRPQWDVIRRQLLVGRDLVLRSAGFQVAFLTAAAVASRLGTAQIAAHQIGLQLWDFIALLLDSFAIAAQSLVGAALGGADERAARSTAWQVGRYGLAAGAGFALILVAGWDLIPRLFTSSPAVLHQAHILWPWFVAMMPAAGIVFALDGVLIGAGDIAFMRTITLLAAIGAFVPINLATLQWNWGIGGVWAGLTAFILVRLVGMVLRTRGHRWVKLGATDPV
jgi:putative MATE family efflux protein